MSKERVLLIIHDRYQSDNFFPLWAGYLSAILKQNNIHVDIYDMSIYHFTNEQLKNYLKENNYSLICIGFLSGRFKQTVQELIQIVYKNKKDAWIVLGGHGAAPSPQYMLNNTNANIIALGEAEETIMDILNAKLYGKSLYDIKGIAFRDGNYIQINSKRNPVMNLDTIPFPIWDLFDMNIYTNNLKFAGMNNNSHAIGLISGRGCYNRCSFCYRMEKGIRARNINNIIAEMKILNEKYNIDYYFFLDELFLFSKNRIKEFAKALNKNKLRILYNANARVDIFDEEIAKILKDSGCIFLNFGFESVDQNVLNLIGKNVTVSQNYKVAEICIKYDINMGINFLWGLPGDTIETLKKNTQFIKEYNTYYQVRTIRPATPYPGTSLLNEAVQKGFIKNEDEFFDVFKNSDLRMFDFCNIPDNIFYSKLLKANTELVLDHYKHTNNDMIAANKIIQGFKDLYEGNTTQFYGARSDTTNEDKRKIGT